MGNLMGAVTRRILFEDIFPLWYRVLILFEFAVLLWYAAIYWCSIIFQINVLQLLTLSYSPYNIPRLDEERPNTGEFQSTIDAEMRDNIALLSGVWRSLKSISVVNVISFLLSKAIELVFEPDSQEQRSSFIEFLSHTIIILTISYNVYKIFGVSSGSVGQVRIHTTFKRIVIGKINYNTMRTNDILLSDTLVSYAKVLNDLVLFLWGTFLGSNKPYNMFLEFFILCIPSIIRIKQCYLEYSNTKMKQHFFNLIKYVTNLGPLFINMLIKYRLAKIDFGSPESSKHEIMKSISHLNSAWYLFSTINSLYSFVWDVKMDWGFQVFDPLFENKRRTTVLRQEHELIYKNRAFYFLIIAMDFFLRFLWTLKIFIVNDTTISLSYVSYVSTFLFGYDAFSFGYVVVEILEILRRWLWCLIKLEYDWTKLNRNHLNGDIYMQ